MSGARPKKWIKGATRKSRKGALHHELHVPEGQRIPERLLKLAAKRKGRVGRQARFALVMRELHRHERQHK